MKFTNVDQVLVEDNLSTGPYLIGGHLDFMQFQGTLSTNIVVRGNVLLPELRGNMQGVFFGVSKANNVLVEDNFIHTSMGNGVFFREGHGIVVQDNTMINLKPGASTFITTPAGSDVSGNIITKYYKAAGFQGTNLSIQTEKPGMPGYVTEYYHGGDKGLGLSLADLGIVKGSLAETMGAAARLKALLGGVIDPPPPTPAPPTTPKILYSNPGDHEIAGNGDVISVAHASKFAVPAGTIAFSFEADTVAGHHGLVTKDANWVIGGGNHFATQLKDGVLSIMFEGDRAAKTFSVKGIQANKEYDVQAAFGGGKVSAWLDGRSLGTASLDTDWTANKEYLQIGAHNGWNTASGSTGFGKVFDGTISDVRVVTGVQTPATMAALGSAGAPPSSGAPAPAPGGDSGSGGDPVWSRTAAVESNGRIGDIVKVSHTAAMELDAGSLSFRFNADKVSGQQALLSKDAPGYAGGGNHVAAWLKDDMLKFRFEDADSQVVFQTSGIKANTNHQVLATFDDNKVSLFLDDRLIGRKDFSIDLGENHQALQIGGWDAPAGGGADTPYDGTISDVFLFDQVMTPADLI